MNVSKRFVPLVVSLIFTGSAAWGAIPTQCANDSECLVELPGATCADGTPSFFTLTKRENAKNLLIYLHGGGACWDKESCEAGYATTLTREEEPTDWNNGDGIHNNLDPKNPLAKDYNIITMPYCTADAYTGSNAVDYGTPGAPYPIRHVGNENVKRMLSAVKTLYPTPDKVVMAGCSAGGIGVTFHLRTLAQTYPTPPKFVVSDAGTPLRPPYVSAEKYSQVFKNWGADKDLPADPITGKPLSDLGELIRFNTLQYPSVKFAFIDAYEDKIMTFFAWAMGALDPYTAVRRTLIDVADNFIGKNAPNAKVFYSLGETHCHTPYPLAGSVSKETNLGDWMTAMISGGHGWENSRPDLDAR